MLTPAPETSAELAAALLVHYSFDLSGHSASELVNRWQNQYPLDWLHLAVIEALYQGRYKGISVQQILAFWLRRGQATYHFNMEFERLICSKFPESLTAMAVPALPPVNKQITFDEKVDNSQSLPVIDDSSPEQVDNGYVQTATLQLKNRTEEEKRVENILASSTLSTVTTGEQQKLSSQEIKSLLQNSPHQIKFLPSAVNHPPIGQFTPETGDRSDSFTSKLKAISGDNL